MTILPEAAQLDVIIPCYNSASTLVRAVESALAQNTVAKVWIIDDGSQDDSVAVALSLAVDMNRQGAMRLCVERLAQNCGAAAARNWGALRSQQAHIAFLDADDAYEANALDAAALALALNPQLGMVRLALRPLGLPEIYTQHAGYPKAWRSMEMTGAGNTVWRRHLFLATGGFPQDALFKRLGGEDAALSLALTQHIQIGTLFDEAGVTHYCRTGTHAEKLLRAHLFGELPEDVTAEALAEANAVTARIAQRLTDLKSQLNLTEVGVMALRVERA